MAMAAEDTHLYDPQCPCPACRARATREWMLTDDLWLFEFGAWQSSPWNIGGAKHLGELQALGTTAYIGKAYHSKPPLPVRYADIAAAVADLDERSQACIELYYVLGVGLPVPKSYPGLFPDQVDAMIRHQAWTADDGWGDRGVSESFKRAIRERRMGRVEGGLLWDLSDERWRQIRHAAIGAIVRRVTGG
jgi:hypothetical protein